MPSSVLVVVRDEARLFNAAGWMLPVEVLSGWESYEERFLLKVPSGAEYTFQCQDTYLNDAPWFVASGELSD